ncbi:pyruvate:ferredoxin (flavodoxin) oxidoreductase [Testudinibacter aquarius]|uniref:Pyruvate-flavodoxin oxidoreductase n=2 Tax=Testudinibacter aquarius TaxID=1524974 RepID=A0A4R3XX69_9PAST|nr:pyruvate:ferredoxin (flavodoxin) oxidoreductase [Testudinibacter aquarius]KAE9529932.1 pyruvate:ferredoxin (flavodoxin) oxidoreductase [Testudinibacter aquarius]TCV83830.1 pyruvate-ferredoxin/flavodoxin oxidoreductase [Testudinibacter aquarius]TNG91458.1 pyruvate:ferredoxin (flavodoxin) oxidoreductase [Testudinibacter aquarius]
MSQFNTKMITCDGSEATASIAYRVSEVCAIYPITPSSTMAELVDLWVAEQQKNIWGNIPLVAEMQSEGGAAGAVHGALQSGALTTTFTASQGLMLMLPNMYKIAGELTSAVFHVAARSLAAQGLSIFGDHQDVMAARTTGFAMLAASSVQESHDMALVAHAATLSARIPFIHFFDGFRTSHEVNKITLIDDQAVKAMIPDELIRAHRARGLSPDNPFIRGTAQNPDVYFQARESVNLYYQNTPHIVAEKMQQLAELTGRQYKIVEYYGDPEAESVIIAMGSGIETVKETLRDLNAKGEKLGAVQVRLYRPLSAEHLLAELPRSVKRIAVLDRTKEPGCNGEPLYQDILTALIENQEQLPIFPKVIAGRYGLSSKEFTPAMVKAVFDELKQAHPKQHFTVGISDDLTHTSLTVDPSYDIESQDTVRAMFYGLGADGTVGANKNTIKIIGDDPDYFAQGYFVYDSKKSGSQTISHLRFGSHPINSPYLIQSANFIACHQETFLQTTDMLGNAAPNATFLLNSQYAADSIWDKLPSAVQRQIIDKNIKLYVIDAYKVAQDTAMGKRINTIMQTCFFALSNVMAKDKAIAKIKKAIEKTYLRKGEAVVQKNFAAVDHTLTHLYPVDIPARVTALERAYQPVSSKAPEFVRQVTAQMMAGKGDLIPVSMLPPDGTYPSATTQWEKRNIAQHIPIWDQALCIQCGNCSFVCPHSAIRAKFYHKALLEQAPPGFRSAMTTARGFPDTRYTIQLYPEDCTGCSLCVDACPMTDLDNPSHKALNMYEKTPYLEQEKQSLTFFETIPYNDRAKVDFSNVRGVQFLQPLFEFSGACSGCGETPYLSLLSRLFGDRLMIANATGCSSIYGGNLPTTPWSKNADGRGPAWSNSLFEDNAEFGFGFRLAETKHQQLAQELLRQQAPHLEPKLVEQLLHSEQKTESQIQAQIKRVAELKVRLSDIGSDSALNLKSVADHLIRRSIWIVGGDGWAYDIGYSGLDHVLASGADVNILVMDTEVYSNTGGQMSKSTPLGAVAKFAASGKQASKKDIAMQAITYNNVYVARIAFGADPQQALLAMREAEVYPGPSLIIAYSHCIAHGIQMEEGLQQQQRAVKSGHWPLFRYNPALKEVGEIPFSLDSLRPSVPLEEYRSHETRFQMLQQQHPDEAAEIAVRAQKVANRKWSLYEEMATRKATIFDPYVE